MEIVTPSLSEEQAYIQNNAFDTYFEGFVWPPAADIGEKICKAEEQVKDLKSHIYRQSKQEWDSFLSEESSEEESMFEAIMDQMYWWLEEYFARTMDFSIEYPIIRTIVECIEIWTRKIIYLTYGFETGDPVGPITLQREYRSDLSLEDIFAAYKEFFRQAITYRYMYTEDMKYLIGKSDDMTAYPDDLDRIEEALEKLTFEELLQVLNERGITFDGEADPVMRDEFEDFVLCGWPDNRQDLLRALEPDGTIGKYLYKKESGR